MNARRILPLFAVVAASTLVFAAAPAAQAQDAKIAIANPIKIVGQIQEYKDTKAKTDARQQDLQNQVNQRQQQLKAMQGELQMLQPGSKEYDAKSQDVLKASIDYEVWVRLTEQQVQREQKQLTKTLVDKVEAAIAAVAKQKGISVVLSDQHPQIPEDLEKIDLQTLNAVLLQRTVWFSDGKLDITEDVKVYLDKQYNDAKAAGGGAASPAPGK